MSWGILKKYAIFGDIYAGETFWLEYQIIEILSSQVRKFRFKRKKRSIFRSEKKIHQPSRQSLYKIVIFFLKNEDKIVSHATTSCDVVSHTREKKFVFYKLKSLINCEK